MLWCGALRFALCALRVALRVAHCALRMVGCMHVCMYVSRHACMYVRACVRAVTTRRRPLEADRDSIARLQAASGLHAGCCFFLATCQLDIPQITVQKPELNYNKK